MRRPMLIAYDIASPRRLYRALKILKAWRLDGQKSVHECLLTVSEAERLKAELTGQLKEEEDKLLMVWLDNRRPIRVCGTGRSLHLFRKLFHIR